MTIAQLAVFLKVVETGSFTRAAQALNMTQPAVSHAITGLESGLGVTLFIRDRAKGLILTDAGNRILVHARGILNLVERIRQEATAETGLEKGTIRIGSFPSVSAHFLPRIIGEFRRRHPRIEIVWLEGTYQEVEEWIQSRVVDLGIIVLPNESLDVIPLARDQMKVLLPPGHTLGRERAIRMEQLDGEPLILARGYETPILSLFEQSGIRLRIEFQVINTRTILKMVEEGLGLAILGQLALPGDLPKLQVCDLEPPFWRHFGLACLKFQEASPAVQLFIRIAQDLFREKP